MLKDYYSFILYISIYCTTSFPAATAKKAHNMLVRPPAKAACWQKAAENALWKAHSSSMRLQRVRSMVEW